MTSCWPSGPPATGTTAELSRTIGPDDIERFTDISGDRNPLHYDLAAALRTTVTRDDGTIALDGTATCYTMTIDTGTGP
jgi:acyl dehydratase